jgi:hypothetical protein
LKGLIKGVIKMKIVEFQNRIKFKLMDSPKVGVFEFNYSDPCYKFIKGFVANNYGFTQESKSGFNGSDYHKEYKWISVDKSIEILTYRFGAINYIYVTAESLVGIINRLIKDHNEFLIDKYKDRARLIPNYVDPYRLMRVKVKI